MLKTCDLLARHETCEQQSAEADDHDRSANLDAARRRNDEALAHARLRSQAYTVAHALIARAYLELMLDPPAQALAAIEREWLADKGYDPAYGARPLKRAIQKGTGAGGDGVDYEAVTYEGYGPGGVAIIAECLVANVNKTAPEVRTIFDKNGGNLGVRRRQLHDLFKRADYDALTGVLS